MRILLLTTLLLSSAALAEPGALLKSSELRTKPFGDADVVATLNAKDKIDITSRKGAWANVKTAAGQQGWVRLLNISTGSGQRGDSGLKSVASLFSTGSSGNTVSTGVKGLSEEQLKNAKPNPAEASRLDQYKDSEPDARNFAKQAKLATLQIDYLSASGGTESSNGDKK
jgi:uncharacterized protein YgiM (DUF1202 family)